MKKWFLPSVIFLILVGLAAFSSQGFLLPLVLSSGFLDGIHPCGFAVLMFFIAFLLSLHRSRSQILTMGGSYIFGVFLAYFLIGLGLLKVFSFFSPHFMAYAGASLLLVLGVVNIMDGLTGRTTLKIPTFTKPYLQHTIERATLPAAFAAGFIVGLCAFPCAGGIYVAILGLIAAKLAFWEGLLYLVLYNIMFVLPLILVLLFASNEKVVEKLELAERRNRKKFKISLGLLMLLLALFILFGGFLK